jgi:hypothetical protein
LAVSIVEVVIALGILTFSAAAVYQQMATVDRQSRLFERMVRRDLLAYRQLQQAVACPHAALAAWTPSETPLPIAGEEPFLRQWSVSDEPGSMLRVRATVGWRARPGENIFAEGSTFTVEGVKAP